MSCFFKNCFFGETIFPHPFPHRSIKADFVTAIQNYIRYNSAHTGAEYGFCFTVFINQIREKVGVIWGSPEVTPGGRALKFYSSVRIDLRRIESIKVGGTVVGSRVRAKIVKNKVAPPFRVAEFDIMFNHGISKESDLIDLGEQMGMVKKNGSFYSFEDTRLGQGKENAKSFLREHQEIAARLESLIRGDSGNTNSTGTDGATAETA